MSYPKNLFPSSRTQATISIIIILKSFSIYFYFTTHLIVRSFLIIIASYSLSIPHSNPSSALKSGPVSVLLPFLEGPRTGPVPESFRMQEPWTGTAKNRKKPVKTGCNWSQNEYIKTRVISVKIGLKL